jgi:hypothetical protein
MARGLNSYTTAAARAAGYRSGFEQNLADYLDKHGIKYEFEKHKLLYRKPVTKGVCSTCESHDVVQVCSYTPDFFLPEHGVYIESKGRWVAADRAKHQLLMDQHSDEDIRLLFEYDGKATPNKRYSEYCKWKGLKYGIVPKKKTKTREGVYLPEEWLEEFVG